jgi:hypothetical protein
MRHNPIKRHEGLEVRLLALFTAETDGSSFTPSPFYLQRLGPIAASDALEYHKHNVKYNVRPKYGYFVR